MSLMDRVVVVLGVAIAVACSVPFLSADSGSRVAKTSIAAVSMVGVLLGVWLLKVYYPEAVT